MKWPVIFLDIDGVLVTRRSLSASKSGIRSDFDGDCVDRLNRLCATTGARVVISSSWRVPAYRLGIGWLLDHFRAQGVNVPVVGMTPVGTPVYGDYRGREIEVFYEAHKRHIGAIAILDDDSDMDPFEGRHVKTGGLTDGLRDVDVDVATMLLREPWPHPLAPDEYAFGVSAQETRWPDL